MAALYEVVEQMHSIELQLAASMVREAERAIEVQQTIGLAAGLDGREALVTGNRMAWSFAATQREVAAWKRAWLEPIRVKREELSEVAREQYAASRVKSEQMNRVTEGAAFRVEIEEGRREQAAMDDRFLSRKLWMENQLKKRVGK